MAAGDAVQLGQPGSNVIVTLADLAEVTVDNVVDNQGTVGTSEEPVGKLVLAAGDVWSTAISNVKKVKIASVEDPDLDDISASAAASSDAVAEVDIEVGGDLIVDSYQIGAEAVGDGKYNATATTTINAGGDVIVTGEEGNGCVYAWAHDGSTNTADVEINAGGDIVVDVQNNSDSEIEACASDAGEFNNANINFAAGGNVNVKAGSGSEADVGAYALRGVDNTAGVNIDADGIVQVKATNGSNANVIASAEYAVKSNTSDIEINAEHVKVTAEAGSNSAINAEAFSAYDEENPENTASVAVYAHAAEVEPGEDSGDVLVEAVMGAGASIEAQTMNAGTKNTSDVLVCADGDVHVTGIMGGDADILADAMNANSNTAKVRVGARGDEGLELSSEDGSAKIESWADYGFTNTAETIVFSEGGVEIVDKASDGEGDGSEIIAMANGYHADAYVGICAEDDIIVMAGIDPEDLEGKVIEGVGGHAIIGAEAWSTSEGYEAEEPSTANADVTVVSHNGGVAVIDAPEVVRTDDGLYGCCGRRRPFGPGGSFVRINPGNRCYCTWCWRLKPRRNSI